MASAALFSCHFLATSSRHTVVGNTENDLQLLEMWEKEKSWKKKEDIVWENQTLETDIQTR